MSAAPSLFDTVADGLGVPRPRPVQVVHSARLSDPPTSHEAARAYQQSRWTQRQRILNLFRYDRSGLTDYQLSQATGIPRHVAARRRKDLVELGLVCDSGYRRPTDTGCAAIVWRLESDPDLADRIREEMGE